MEDEVAVAIALPGVDKSKVRGQGLLKDKVGTVEGAHLLGRRRFLNIPVGVVLLRQPAFGHLGAHAGFGIKSGDPGAAGTQLLRQGSLRGEDHLQFTGEVLAGELLVLPHVGTDGSPDAAVLEEDAKAPVVHAAVVADRLQSSGALLMQGVYQRNRNSAQSEPADGQRGTVRDVLHRFRGAGNNLVNHP